MFVLISKMLELSHKKTFKIEYVYQNLLQIQGESKTLASMGGSEVMAGAAQNQYRGVVGTVATIARNEGPL